MTSVSPYFDKIPKNKQISFAADEDVSSISKNI